MVRRYWRRDLTKIRNRILDVDNYGESTSKLIEAAMERMYADLDPGHPNYEDIDLRKKGLILICHLCGEAGTYYPAILKDRDGDSSRVYDFEDN